MYGHGMYVREGIVYIMPFLSSVVFELLYGTYVRGTRPRCQARSTKWGTVLHKVLTEPALPVIILELLCCYCQDLA